MLPPSSDPDRMPRRRPVGLGALAVAGVVVAFSMSSTLAKRAETPGVLLAFWRMVTVAVVWNVYVLLTGRRVTLAGVRQVALPGVFLGLNLALFFLGATRNSVANAALIGSLSPFLIVPAGARLFREHLVPPALACALVAFVGVTVVLLGAPAGGDASPAGNVLGLAAMVLWVAYIVSTRGRRGDMDVATFMATITPVAAVTLVPLAVADGDVVGLSRTGWTYVLILSLLTGVAAHGLNVFAQRTIAIGTIGVAQVAQPALAVVWSYLLLGETLRGPQVLGIALVSVGLLAFLLLTRRAGRPAPPSTVPRGARSGRGSDAAAPAPTSSARPGAAWWPGRGGCARGWRRPPRRWPGPRRAA